MEPIDHDAIEPGQYLHLTRRFLRQVPDSVCLAHAPEHQADQLAGVQIRLDHARFSFDDEIGARKWIATSNGLPSSGTAGRTSVRQHHRR